MKNKPIASVLIGEKEVAEGKAAVRRQGKGDIGIKSIEEIIADFRQEIENRSFE